MRLRKDVVDQLMKERGMSLKDLARGYKGNITEYAIMCNIKCGFRRAYQIAEMFDCTVDDIVTYGDEKWPRWHRPEDDGRTRAGKAKLEKRRKREQKLKEKKEKEEKLRQEYMELFKMFEELEKDNEMFESQEVNELEKEK